MIKKGLLLIFLALTITAGTAYSTTGVGIFGEFMGNSALQGGGGIGLSLKFGNFPVLGLQWTILPDMLNLGVTCDYWVVNQHLGGILDYYLGIGLYLGVLSGGRRFELQPGARIPIGLQIWPVNKLELFIEFAPMLTFLPSLGIGYNIRGGLRVHF